MDMKLTTEMCANLFFHILNNLYLRIKITDRLDDVCHIGKCATQDCITGTVPKIDRKVAQEYGIEIGKEYSVMELVEKNKK